MCLWPDHLEHTETKLGENFLPCRGCFLMGEKGRLPNPPVRLTALHHFNVCFVLQDKLPLFFSLISLSLSFLSWMTEADPRCVVVS